MNTIDYCSNYDGNGNCVTCLNHYVLLAPKICYWNSPGCSVSNCNNIPSGFSEANNFICTGCSLGYVL